MTTRTDGGARIRSGLIFALVLGSAAVFIAAIGAWVSIRERSEQLAMGAYASQVQAQLLAEHSAAVFRQIQSSLHSIVPLFAGGDFEDRLPAGCAAVRRMVVVAPALSNAAIVDGSGNVRYCTSPGLIPAIDTEQLQELHKERMLDFDVDRLIAGDDVYMRVSVRLDTQEGAYGGAVVGLVSRDYFVQRFEDYGTIDVHLIAMYGPFGTVLAGWAAAQEQADDLQDIALLSGLPATELLTGGLKTMTSTRVIASVYPLPDFPYRIVVAYETGALLSDWRRRTCQTGAILAFLIITIVVSATLVRRTVSRRLKTEAELAQSKARELEHRTKTLQRLRALAGSLAHDINNRMMVVGGNAEIIRLAGHLPPDTLQSVDRIRDAAERAAQLCERMLAAAGGATMSARTIEPMAVIRENELAFRELVGTDVVLRLKADEPLPRVTADTYLLRQAIAALLENAKEALGESDRTIELHLAPVDHCEAGVEGVAISEELPAGRYLGISVRDSGSGMGPDILAKVFDPFFSTRFIGRGLGLPAAAGTARQHGGAIIAESREGAGSRVTILLPCCPA